ncbi:SrfA family protein [Pseudorhodoferax sp. Leaf267]|uniref:SrfA family protein n=1 Tax=Pseudorhodoferax sp. Leaf267 TaxID=1736316 RepID=UPI0006FD9D14|nr:SrfA family protein [Pseudorhodoferax sp. Leaf267]KQP11874.1 hypothetical protein ASF43_23260 [Pseudorhodoferax sp. Leaf267]
MNSAVTGAQLAHDKIDRYRSLGAFGKPVYQSHVQLRAMLKTKLGERAANYFAKPTFDPDLGELRWTAEVTGAARGWHEMTPEEQAERALDLEVMRSQLMGYARELREKGGAQPGGAASFASLLEQATRVPAQGDFLYFVGDQPVIVFWGFEDHSGASVDPAAQAPRYAAPAAATALPPVAAPPDAAAVEKRKRPWWWWLLWLLLALLLLALLLLLPRACTPTGIDLGRVLPGASAPQAPASAPADAASAPQGLPSAPLPGAAPGATTPGGDASPNMQLPTQPGADPALPSASAPDDTRLPTLQPDAALPPASSASVPGQTAPIEPPVADRATDPPVPERSKEPRATDPLPPPNQGAMQMPEKADKARPMAFLEGDWKAGDGLVDKTTKQPLDLSFKFSKDGQGEVLLRRPDGTTCRGAVQGRMDGGKLGIQGNQSIPCSNGSAYGAPKIECAKERGGQTQCYGVNADGSRYSMGMQRQSR